MLLQLGDSCDCMAQAEADKDGVHTTQGEHIRDEMEKGAVEVPVQVADVLTKPLSRMKFG